MGQRPWAGVQSGTAALLSRRSSARHEQHPAASRIRLSAERPNSASAAGSGTYFSDALTVDAFWPKYNTQLLRIQYTNDGRANFAADPLNGSPLPTYDEAQALLCNSAAAGRELRSLAGERLRRRRAVHSERAPGDAGAGRVHEAWRGAGTRRSASSGNSAATMALEMDYVHTKGSGEKDTIDNVNLAYDATTGANLPYTNANRARLPWPDMGIISMIPHNTRSSLRSLQTAFTKRMSNRWQASATYTLSWFYNAENQPFQGLQIVPFTVAARPGQRVHARGRRPAASRGVQRHLAGRQRLPGERASLLRRRHPQRRPTTAATCEISAPAAPAGCVRTAPSYRATPSCSRRRTRPTSASSSAIPLGGRVAVDVHRRGLQRVQPAELDGRPHQESAANFDQRTSAQYRHGAARLQTDVLTLAVETVGGNGEGVRGRAVSGTRPAS